jgi:hypothetical protein
MGLVMNGGSPRMAYNPERWTKVNVSDNLTIAKGKTIMINKRPQVQRS